MSRIRRKNISNIHDDFHKKIRMDENWGKDQKPTHGRASKINFKNAYINYRKIR